MDDWPTGGPLPTPWSFAERIYGIAHCLIDRDGRVIGCNLPIGNGPLLEHPPVMAQMTSVSACPLDSVHYPTDGAVTRVLRSQAPSGIVDARLDWCPSKQVQA